MVLKHSAGVAVSIASVTALLVVVAVWANPLSAGSPGLAAAPGDAATASVRQVSTPCPHTSLKPAAA